jgi:cytochrome c oxidase subunit 4
MSATHVETTHDEGHDHPSPRKYVFIAVVLSIITAVEIAASYIEMPDGVLVTSLLVMAVVKFFLVASWFMHLKFDHPLFKRLFLTGIITSLLVFGVVLWIFLSRGGPSPVITG